MEEGGDTTGSEGAGGGVLSSPSPSSSSSPPPPAAAASAAGIGLVFFPPPPPPPPPQAHGHSTMMISEDDLSRKKQRQGISPAVAAGVEMEMEMEMEIEASSPATPLSRTATTNTNVATAPATDSINFPSSVKTKRGRGRPPGSGRRQVLAALGEWFAYSAGGNFTPHIITVATGEDVASRILSLSQKGPRAICILSANGAISNVTLRQPGSSGGTFSYEGRFEILSLSGSFTITESGGIRSRAGGISISLAGPDGRVVGGGVAGLLVAASPIQVVVGSFSPNTLSKEHKRKFGPETSSGTGRSAPTAPVVLPAVATPISQATPDRNHCDTPISAALPGQNLHVHREAQNNGSSVASFRPTAWYDLSSSAEQSKPSPDINICLPRE